MGVNDRVLDSSAASLNGKEVGTGDSRKVSGFKNAIQDMDQFPQRTQTHNLQRKHCVCSDRSGNTETFTHYHKFDNPLPLKMTFASDLQPFLVLGLAMRSKLELAAILAL